MMLPLLISFLFVLILSSGFLSATETAFFSLSSMKVRAFEQGRDRRGQIVARLLSRPRKLLVTILMVNIFMNILVQNVVSSIFGTLSGWALNVGVPLALSLVFGEVIPKAIALANNAKVACAAAPILNVTEKVIGPVRDCMTAAVSVISRIMFFFLRKESEVSLDELKVALKNSKKIGFLNQEEANLVRGYLNLDDDLVKEIMRPRQEFIAFDIQQDLSILRDLFVDEECSRIPVYDQTLENLLGIISSASFFLHQKQIHSSEDLKVFLEKPYFIPESTSAKVLLCHFYEREENMAIAVDEYGSICGLITLEDLVEVVVGQIADRRDEKSRYTRAGEDVIIASGKMELGEFEEIFDVHLESPNNMATIGGWLTEQFGDLPKEGTKYVTSDFLFHVLSSDTKRVRRIYIRKLAALSGKKKKSKTSGDS